MRFVIPVWHVSLQQSFIDILFICDFKIVPSSCHTNLSVQDMIQKRNLSFEHSFQEIKSKPKPKQRKCIFENLSELQNTSQSNHTSSKRDHPIQEYADDIT
jgi:hypothetical protein